MTLRARIINAQTVLVTGSNETASTVERAAKALAKRLQQAIANLFQNQQTYGGTLKPNKADYTVRKVLGGGSPLRGHDTGRLQKAIENVQSWSVTTSSRGATIRFTDNGVKSAVPYAKYYAAEKVVGARIFGVRTTWLSDMNKFLAGIRGAKKTPRRRTSGALTRAIAAAATTRRRDQRTTVEVG